MKKLTKWYLLAILIGFNIGTIYFATGDAVWCLLPIYFLSWFVALKITYWREGYRL